MNNRFFRINKKCEILKELNKVEKYKKQIKYCTLFITYSFLKLYFNKNFYLLFLNKKAQPMMPYVFCRSLLGVR